MKKFILLILCSVVCGCKVPDTPVPLRYTDKEASYNSITCTRDSFKKTTWCYSAPVADSQLIKNINGQNVFDINGWRYMDDIVVFRTAQKDSVKKYDIIQLYFEMNGACWVFYNSAYDMAGNKLDFVEIDRQVDHCAHGICSCKEEFAINVDKKYLKKYENKGLTIRLYGKYGEKNFSFRPEYIQGLVKHLENIKVQK